MMRTLAVLAALLAVVPTSVLADDIFPRPWRSQPRTVFQQWEFDTLDKNLLSDVMTNPCGTPELVVTPFPDEWYPTYGDPIPRVGA